jgi:hypothetical protein
MKQIAWLLTTLASLLAVIESGRTQTRDENYNKMRATIEQQIRNEYKQGSAEIIKQILATNPNFKDRQVIEDWIKGLFYNKAYNFFFCIKSAGGQPSSGTERLSGAETCYEERNKQAAKVTTIMIQYASLLLSKPKEVVQCDLQARLFDAEIDFPPFDFLKQSSGRDALYDNAAMSACLMSINR